MPWPKIRIQDPQDLTTKYNVKIQDLQDPTAKSHSQNPRSPGSQHQTEIQNPGSPGSHHKTKKKKIQGLQDSTMKLKTRIQDPQDPRSPGPQYREDKKKKLQGSRICVISQQNERSSYTQDPTTKCQRPRSARSYENLLKLDLVCPGSSQICTVQDPRSLGSHSNIAVTGSMIFRIP